MEERTFDVPAISCGHCVRTIERELGRLEGVISVRGDSDTKRVTVSFDGTTSQAAILGALAEIGYPAAS